MLTFYTYLLLRWKFFVHCINIFIRAQAFLWVSSSLSIPKSKILLLNKNLLQKTQQRIKRKQNSTKPNKANKIRFSSFHFHSFSEEKKVNIYYKLLLLLVIIKENLVFLFICICIYDYIRIVDTHTLQYKNVKWNTLKRKKRNIIDKRKKIYIYLGSANTMKRNTDTISSGYFLFIEFIVHLVISWQTKTRTKANKQ